MTMGDFQEIGGEPTSPPPDANKPYLWFGGQWWLMAQDSTDGVPDDLSTLDDNQAQDTPNP